MKPCWYVDPMGVKCHNEGIKVSIVEDMILDIISEHKASLQKQKHALEVVNDAYELGDYTRDE